jgi:hypothetical protein
VVNSRTTKAYKVFETNLERSRAFLRIFKKEDSGGRSAGAPSGDEKELLRGCLVFAVGALDAYLGDLILELVPQFAPKNTQLKSALTQIAKNDPGLALRVTLAPASDKHGEFRTALGDWLEGKSFQGAEKVSNALGYVGSNLTLSELDKQTKVNTARELERVTQERHDIVHRGQKPFVKQALAEETVRLIQTIARAIDRDVCSLYF